MKPVNRNIVTPDKFTIQSLCSIPNATGKLSVLLRDIGLAAKRVNASENLKIFLKPQYEL